MLGKTLLVFIRNLPVFLSIYWGIRLVNWDFYQRASLIVACALLSSFLISYTERFLDHQRTGFSHKDFITNSILFSVMGLFMCWYFQRGGYAVDIMAGIGLALILSVGQYIFLGEDFFFDKIRALLFYMGGLLIISPIFLVSIRYSVSISNVPSIILIICISLFLSPILLYMNYGGDI